MVASYEIKLLNGDILTFQADNVDVTATSITGILNGVIQWVTPLSQVVSVKKV